MLNETEIKEAVDAVMKAHPLLNYEGYGLGNGWQINHQNQTSNEVLAASRKTLRENAGRDFSEICEWLNGRTKSKTINTRHSSYGLKHIVEKRLPSGYCSNGQFILVALHCGFRMSGSYNVCFNIAEKSITPNAACRELGKNQYHYVELENFEKLLPEEQAKLEAIRKENIAQIRRNVDHVKMFTSCKKDGPSYIYSKYGQISIKKLLEDSIKLFEDFTAKEKSILHISEEEWENIKERH